MALNENIGDSLISLGQNVKAARTRGIIERQCWLWALIGAVVIGVTLPTILVCWNCGQRGPLNGLSEVPWLNRPWQDVAADWVGLQVVATIFCGPGAVILGLLLYSSCKKRCVSESKTLRETIVYGMWVGGLAAFLNFPGYFSGGLIRGNGRVLFLVPLLFAVAGASCGAWIGWQAWRALHPEERFWPRFSLGTLMIAVFAWGLLLAVFAPK